MTTSADTVLAGGLPLSAAVADEAIAWLTLLMSGEATDEDRRRWHGWRAAHADHERAWLHIEAMGTRLRGLHGGAAYASLTQRGAARGGRRKALRSFAWLGAAGLGAVLAMRTEAWRSATADHRTATGERRELTLADGTRVLLDSGTAITLRFDAQRRVVRLVSGQALFSTGHGPAAGLAPGGGERPFVVQTAQGEVQALGTRFVVRQDEDRSRVTVLEGAVALQPAGAATRRRVLQAGSSASLLAMDVTPPMPAGEQALGWTRGLLVVDEMRLDDFLAELSRYRSGFLRCDPQVAGLRFSGVFPLEDTDRILAQLPSTLPVQLSGRTRWWVVVEAAAR